MNEKFIRISTLPFSQFLRNNNKTRLISIESQPKKIVVVVVVIIGVVVVVVHVVVVVFLLLIPETYL